MEDILINIDSKYRDTTKYSNECKFRINFEKTYKNIVSIRMTSLEINNSINYISSQKNNNFIKVHLPNKQNDPSGTIIKLNDGLIHSIDTIKTNFNDILSKMFNSNGLLQQNIDNNKFAEKYFYIFYLNESVTLNFDFNQSVTLNFDFNQYLQNKLTLLPGWYSIYGIVYKIHEYIIEKYNERVDFVNQNTNSQPINLDFGNFQLLSDITLKVYDRRFRSTLNLSLDCIRIDKILKKNFMTNNLQQNLNDLKIYIYKTYIKDTTNFITEFKPESGNVNTQDFGILDYLTTNTYIIPNDYINAGLLKSQSKYYINNYPDIPSTDNIQLYNLSINTDTNYKRVYFTNSFTKCYYYWSDITEQNISLWKKTENNNITNLIDNLLDKKYLFDNKFITITQFNNPNYKGTLEKDIPSFDIDFCTSTNTNSLNTSTNIYNDGIVDINRIKYPSIGNYIGFRPELTKKMDSFVLSSNSDSTNAIIRAAKFCNTSSDNYIFIKLNDIGYVDFLNQKYFAKILLSPCSNKSKIDAYVNQTYRFRQPTNINKLDLELVDYLGNTLDLNGFDWSCTFELSQVISSDQKDIFEKQSIMFNY